MCTFGLFHSWLTTDMEWTNHMGAGSSMLLNAVFSRSSLISTALSLTVFSLCVCCSVLVCVGVCDAAVRSLTAAVPLSWHLSSVLICWARCCCVYENVHYFACVLVCSFSLSRCRCFIGLSFTTRLLCVYSFSTRVHVCAFICAVFRYCCSLSLMVCALQVSHRTQAYYCKVPHAIFYHAFDTEHTSSFMECDRFDWTDRASEGEWERWIVCVCWPNIYEKHRYISQHNNEKTEKNKWINTFRIVAQIIMVLVFKYHTQTTLLHTSRHWLTAANVLFAKRYIRTSHNQL